MSSDNCRRKIFERWVSFLLVHIMRIRDLCQVDETWSAGDNRTGTRHMGVDLGSMRIDLGQQEDVSYDGKVTGAQA
jgi:hypothetical protein